MRIVIVSNPYRPHVSARAFRWSAVAEHWAARGDQIDVVAGWSPGEPREEVLDGVRVWRVGGGLSERLRHRLAGGRASGGRGAAARIQAPLRRSLAGTAMRLVHDLVWKNVYWPDYACLWYFHALRKARELLARRPCDVLITSSLPFTDHMVGRRLKRAAPDVPWLIDVGDPFCFLKCTPTNNHSLYGGLNQRFEKSVFRRADAISVTNENTRRIYAGLFPDAAGRMSVIPPLLRDDVVWRSAEPLFSDNGRIRLVFVGTLHPVVRTPEHVLAAFEALLATPPGDRLELHFFGATNRCERYFEPYRALLGKRLFVHGGVDHQTARQAMIEADCLVNIGNATTYQLPSKLVEYANTGRRILNFATTPEDTSAQLLSTYPAALSVLCPADEGEADAAARQIDRVAQFLTAPYTVDPESVLTWCRPFRIDSVVAAYDSLIERARSRAGRPVETRTSLRRAA